MKMQISGPVDFVMEMRGEEEKPVHNNMEGKIRRIHLPVLQWKRV